MKAVLAAILVALLAAPLAAMPATAQDRQPAERLARYVPIVETGETVRWDGGHFVHVRMGDVALAVLWSENASMPTGVRMVIDYGRFFGAAELYDDQGNYLRTVGLPLHTALIQEFDHMVEFRDLDNDSLFDLGGIEGRTNFTGDQPVKFLNLRTAWYLDGAIERVVDIDRHAAWVNFTLRADGVPYARVFNSATRTWANGTAADGALDRISLRFRLAASAHEVRAEVPFYRVTVPSANERSPLRSEFLGNRTVAGVSVAVNGKYDQRIEGWDFGFPASKLALATRIGFGNFIEPPVVRWLQAQFGGACISDTAFAHCESDAGPTRPVRIARDHLEIAEGWHRAGDVYWVSDVTVDGRPARMTFEIYHIERALIPRGDRDYGGFRAFGAFVYPQGQSIVHDPGMSASSVFAALPEPTNLASSFLVGLQLAVVAIALIPAILLRRRGRKGMP